MTDDVNTAEAHRFAADVLLKHLERTLHPTGRDAVVLTIDILVRRANEIERAALRGDEA